MLSPEKETRASGAHRALPNARSRVPQRRSEGGAWGGMNRRMARAGGERARRSSELQWRRRRSTRAGRERENERGGAGRPKWQRGRRRTRPGAPGGRPGRVQVAACAPRGGRALPACHGVAAQPSAHVDAALARAGRG